MNEFELITSLTNEEKDALKNYVEQEINKLRQEIRKEYLSKRDHDRFLDKVIRGR